MSSTESTLSSPPKSPPDITVGSLVGLAAGGAAGWACLWILGQTQVTLAGVAVGAAVGLLIGAVCGYRARRQRTDAATSDLGTTVSIACSLPFAAAVVLGGLAGVNGRLTGYLMVGIACAGPMAGLLVGGLVDRLYEGYLRRQK